MSLIDQLDQLAILSEEALRLAETGEVLGKDREAAKAIGQAVHDIGGMDAMRIVYRTVRHHWLAKNLPYDEDAKFAPSFYDCAWDRVGDWRW